MKTILLVFVFFTISWTQDSLTQESAPPLIYNCPADSNLSDSTQIDSLHVGRISHHLNSRNSNEGEAFDWFLNLQGYYKYNSGWNPDARFEVSTEREDGDRYDAYLVSHATDYYFIRDRVDEENDLYLFETGVHYTLLSVRHGYSYLWWSNTRTERHAIYHRFEGDWLNAEIQYMDRIFKTEIQLFIEQKWPIGSDNIFFNLNGNYLKIYEQPKIWTLGYIVGYEW